MLAEDEGPLRKERIDIQRKVSLKFKEFRGFITEFSENISTGGMFIRTTRPQPPGSIFDFELTLGEDYTLIHGLGEVVWVRDRDEGFDRPAGMGVRFLSLDPDSRKLIDEIVAQRLEKGDDAAPGPLDGWGMDEGAAGGEDGAEGKPAGEASFGLEAPPIAGSGSVESSSRSAPESQSSLPFSSSSSGNGLSNLVDLSGAGSGHRDSDDAPRTYAGHSPYARSYHASVTQGSASVRSRRPLVVVLLVVVALAVVGAGFFLLFPEKAMDLMVGGRRGAATEQAPAGALPIGPSPAAQSAPSGAQAPETSPTEETAPAESAAAPGAPAEEPPAESAAERGPAPATAGETGSAPGRAPSGERSEPSAGGALASRPSAAPEQVPTAPARQAPSATAPVPPAPEGEPFTRILNITYEQRGPQLVVTIYLDGVVREWDYTLTHISAPPPRELIRLRGAQHPFPRTTIPVTADLVKRIRTGFHPHDGKDEIHVVLDLAADDVVVERSEAAGREIRLYLGREQPEGEQDQAPGTP